MQSADWIVCYPSFSCFQHQMYGILYSATQYTLTPSTEDSTKSLVYVQKTKHRFFSKQQPKNAKHLFLVVWGPLPTSPSPSSSSMTCKLTTKLAGICIVWWWPTMEMYDNQCPIIAIYLKIDEKNYSLSRFSSQWHWHYNGIMSSARHVLLVISISQ